MRFTGGNVTEEKCRNGKSSNPKHWRICLSFTYDEERTDGTTKKKRKRVTGIVEGAKTHAYERRDKLISELDGKGEALDEIVQQQKEQEGRQHDPHQAHRAVGRRPPHRQQSVRAHADGGPQAPAPREVPSGKRARQGHHHPDGRADLRRRPQGDRPFRHVD